ncbi:MAG: hypothetical protein L6R38_007726 [Xanthoria sp. 2 TBL-2021]|nr:MAG: hypothetical protein L6R38_007726 [Xanthoria sp. 2 TBL-2021]
MATSSAHIPTWADGVTPTSDDPSMNPYHVDISSIIAIAELKPSHSILVMNCTYKDVFHLVLKQLGANHGRVVGVDHRREELGRLVGALRAEGLDQNVELLLFSHYTHLHKITGLRDILHPTSPPTFDTVFAPIPLPFDPQYHQGLLHRWASCLTPATGRMIVQLYPGDNKTLQVAGVQAVNSMGIIMVKMRSMLDREWSQTEESFRSLVGAAGLQVAGIRRLSLQGDDVADHGELFETMASDAFKLVVAKDPSWVNPDGTFSAVWKRMFMWEALQRSILDIEKMLRQDIAGWEGLNAAEEKQRAVLLAGTLEIVPVVASMAAVLSKNV